MTFLIENWCVIVVIICAAVFCGAAIGGFVRMPSEEQRVKVKEWLLWAVTEAEKDLGCGTGKLKLRQVYDLFVQRFPDMAKVISFDTFSMWVDEALLEMRMMITSNKCVRELVKK